MPAVKFKIDADGSGAKTVLQGISGQVKSLGSTTVSMASSVKGALAAAFGIGSIGALVKTMADFADEIQNAADNLQLTVEQVQILRTAARHAGKDLGFFEGVFTKLDVNLSKALKKGSKENALAAVFGLSETDLRTGQKYDVLKKVLEQTKTMSDYTAKQRLGELVGPKNAGSLLAMREEILSPTGQKILSADAIGQMDELMDAFEDLKDTIVVSLLPAFLDLVRAVHGTIGSYTQETKDFSEMNAEAMAIVDNAMSKTFGAAYKPVKVPLLEEMNVQSELIGAATDFHLTAQERKAKAEEIKKRAIIRRFGADVYEEMMAEHKVPESFEAQLEVRREQRKIEREKRDALRAIGSEREAPIEKPKKPKKAEQFLEASLGSNEFMRIGGMLGVDVQYRLERLSIEANEYLARIADGIENMNDKLDDYSMTPETEQFTE